jgi:hypothetical protein
MAKYTWKVDPDPTHIGKWMFVVKRDGKVVAAQGQFESAKAASAAARDCQEMFDSVRPN